VRPRYLLPLSWIAGGQAITAIGTLVGVRLLTGRLSPREFGVLSLLLGISALMVSVIAAPISQAAIYLYPQHAAEDDMTRLRAALGCCLGRVLTIAVTLIAVAGVTWWLLDAGSFALTVILAALLAVDAWRTVSLALLSSMRAYPSYAIWQAGEAWGRPLFAVVFISYFSSTAATALVGYLLASLLLLLVGARRSLPLRSPRDMHTQRAQATAVQEIESKLWRFAWPLVPLGMVGWANGLADRYLIGGMLSLADAGVYAAVYGLASRPMLMLGGSIELLVRPLHQQAVKEGNTRQARRLLGAWIIVVLVVGVAIVFCFAYWQQQIAAWLLSAEFQRGAQLMPWIAAGYVLLVASYAFERVCYAHARTHRILLIESTTACAALISVIVGVSFGGLRGAAMAVPAYYMVQFVAAGYFAWRTLHEVPLQLQGAYREK
jgi:O-antigen/teichoic acid export membrane protein